MNASQPLPTEGQEVTQLQETGLFRRAYDAPALYTPDRRPVAIHGRNGQQPLGRGRSISHSYPSTPHGKKHGHGYHTAMESDSGDSNNRAMFSALMPQSPLKSGASRSAKAQQDRDLTTGKCMACDSMVRWPKELAVFRCSVCVTINDLTPISTVQDSGGDHHRHRTRESSSPSRVVSPITARPDSTSKPMCVATEIPENPTKVNETSCSEFNHVGCERCLNTEDSKTPTVRNWYGSSVNGSPHPAEQIDKTHVRCPNDGTRNIFGPLEDYIVASFQSHDCINGSFSTKLASVESRGPAKGSLNFTRPVVDERRRPTPDLMPPMGTKTIPRGLTENAAWLARDGAIPSHTNGSISQRGNIPIANGPTALNDVNRSSPRIDWDLLFQWYDSIIHVGDDWSRHMAEILSSVGLGFNSPSIDEMNHIEGEVAEAQRHTRRVLLRATEGLLKRPGRLLNEPSDTRFLLIILANPLLYPSSSPILRDGVRVSRAPPGYPVPSKIAASSSSSKNKSPLRSPLTTEETDTGPGHHSGIIKRILGLLSNLPNECHHHLVSWFSEFSEVHFQQTTELVGSFVTYRLTRQNNRRRDTGHDPTGGLVPNMPSSGHRTMAALHAELNGRGQGAKFSTEKRNNVKYNDDWQIRAAARVMALLFAANNNGSRRRNALLPHPSYEEHHIVSMPHERTYHRNQILPTSHFYNTLLDYSDLIADFEAWEAKRGKFTFCQYPFFLSIWAKIQIMEHDARRQMEIKAREAFFDSIMTRKSVNQYLVLKVRRDCLVEDSLKGVSEVVGGGGEEIKKGLRIEFKGEEGIDAGGLRKEWFLLLVRDVLNPEHGMFVYDEESHVCYFNPSSFETSDQFFLVGVVLGLAIYNSTILDVALPSFAFRKLLAAGPSSLPGPPSHAKPTMVYTLDDLAEYRPSLAHGLRQLLEFDGDVEETFCRDFVADVEKYGKIHQVPLCPDGEKRAVNNSNRREFVNLYVKYLLDTSVVRQFEPFKRGFYTVCGGNALSLFRPEEIELLIRGSDEPLDISSLEAVSVCENWGVPNPAETELVIQWFWQSFKNADPKDQRKLLSFITGSDRIPAMGAANLVIKLSCLGDDSLRFPIARTCFNMLSLWRYSSRTKFERLLWRAVNESEGFGLK
ncbi:hypothetical protein V501_02766 [Pseudogymnoascus sp. VKM F-4519 (FW-2642)]|nr:hypothetical protein V501_02766 [Pseudogymnoascus sp. VKM F-4519 (FW-2642)]